MSKIEMDELWVIIQKNSSKDESGKRSRDYRVKMDFKGTAEI
nr:hypothetical protein [Methanosarcina mazei]